MIVGTAGHIDHGKTALVHALTGVDTDRLKEEKARGITIELGYAYQPLEGGEVLGFIDVPGHERLVHTMLSGSAGIDLALLVVAADDGIMPQTREHLEIMEWLEIRHAVVALNKVDCVDAAQVDSVERDVRAALSPTRLSGSAVFRVSARTGEGVDALRSHLHERAATLPRRRSDGRFRLAVDRSFTLHGVGTVVTGTVFAGTVEVGTELVVSPDGRTVRVRGLHAQNRPADTGYAGQRCALNLAGIEKAAVTRGQWLVDPALHRPTDRFDMRLRLAKTAPVLRHWSPVHLHLGATHVMARVVLLQGDRLSPGEEGLVQIVTDRPIGALHSDLVVLRDAEARRTLGGGRVLDVAAPARRRRTVQRITELHALAVESVAERLATLLASAPHGLDLTTLARDWNSPDLDTLLPQGTHCVRDGAHRYAIASPAWASLQHRLLDALEAYHVQRPDEVGPDVARARRMWMGQLPLPLFRALVEGLVGEARLVRSGAWLHHPGHSVALSEREVQLAPQVLALLDAQPLDPPWVRTIAQRLSCGEAEVRSLLLKLSGQGRAYQVVRDLFFSPGVISRFTQVLHELGAEDGRIRAADLRDRLGIGRKRCVQILEYFDRVGLTRRVRDVHVLRPESGIVGQVGPTRDD